MDCKECLKNNNKIISTKDKKDTSKMIELMFCINCSHKTIYSKVKDKLWF